MVRTSTALEVAHDDAAHATVLPSIPPAPDPDTGSPLCSGDGGRLARETCAGGGGGGGSGGIRSCCSATEAPGGGIGAWGSPTPVSLSSCWTRAVQLVPPEACWLGEKWQSDMHITSLTGVVDVLGSGVVLHDFVVGPR